MSSPSHGGGSLQAFHGSKVRCVLDRVLTLKPRHLALALSLGSTAGSPNAPAAAATVRASAQWLLPKLGRLLHVFDFGFSGACAAQGNACPLSAADWAGQLTRWTTGTAAEPPPLDTLFECTTSVMAWLRADPQHVALVLAPSAAQLAVLLTCQAALHHAASPVAMDAVSSSAVCGAGASRHVPPRALFPMALSRMIDDEGGLDMNLRLAMLTGWAPA